MAKTKASKRKATKRPARAAAKKTAKKAQPRKKAAPKRRRAIAKAGKASPQKARRKAAPKRAVRVKAAPKRKAKGRVQAKPSKPARKAAAAPKPKTPVLQRERRRLPDAERLDVNRDMTDDHMMAAARSGGRGLKADLKKQNETSPAMTAGDVDANWEDAYAVGDEAPGGDNPTPDQDRVDDIGKALGITYQDNEELQGGDEITERDAKRWELDPASSDDWPHKE
jgi:hypothetical protein